MKRRNLVGGVCLAVLMTLCTPVRGAAGEDLRRAIDLYNAADYVQARDLLQNLDAANLTDQQRATRTNYLARTRQALVDVEVTGQPRNIDRARPVYRQSEVPRIQADTSRRPGETFIRYPGNWAEICRRQERYGALQRTEDKPTREARQKFAAIVREISFEPAVLFADAIERIRRESGLNIVVNWPALGQYGVTRDQEVTLPRLTSITWRKLTELVLQQVSASLGGVAQLDWAIEDGVLAISTREDLSTHLTLRVYDIGDLLVPRQVVQLGGGFSLTGTPGGAGGSAGGGGAGSASGAAGSGFGG